MGKIGFGYGSEWHLLRCMGRHRNNFNKKVCDSLNIRRQEINWLDFKFNDNQHNYDKNKSDKELEGLEFINDPVLQNHFRTWWPQQGKKPTWDAVGRAEDKLILVEAKAHWGEIGRESRSEHGSYNDLTKIMALNDFVEAEAGNINLNDSWLGTNYQLANRLAFRWFFQEHGYETHLILIYFFRDKPRVGINAPQNQQEWEQIINSHWIEMGLENYYSNNVHKLFLDVTNFA